MFKEALYYTRMAWHYGRFVKLPPIKDPRATIRANIERREENFLNLVRDGIFENPKSPYRQLLRLAGCTFEDLRASVSHHGLERTLKNLRQAGVYLTHAEVKGKPIYRHGREVPNDVAATANPNASRGIEAVSSGSRSRGTATPTSNTYRQYRECYEILAREEFGAQDHVCGLLRPILPSPAALIASAGFARSGQPAERWFTVGKSFQNGGLYSFATTLLVVEARLLGCRVPFPTYLEDNDFLSVARWIAENKRRGVSTFLRTGASWGTRMCAAALDEGLDISGSVLMVAGEPISIARRRVFDAAKVEAFGRYVISEMGTIGISCRHTNGNSVHLFTDAVAVIGHRRPAPYADTEVNSLLFTSVHPNASRLYINAEMEDAATLVPATCDCVFSRLGYHTILQDVYSFGKLSGHGITLGGHALLSIIEEQLPSRFGGRPGDYQLVETEGKAQLELRLRVSSRVQNVDVESVQAFFLEQVRSLYGGSLSARTWESTSSFRVERAEPYQTRTGKVHALHLTAFGRG
jgi:hypothetical protein